MQVTYACLQKAKRNVNSLDGNDHMIIKNHSCTAATLPLPVFIACSMEKRRKAWEILSYDSDNPFPFSLLTPTEEVRGP